jgi:hypothetical protein
MKLMQVSAKAPTTGVIAQGPGSPVTVTVTGADGKTQTLEIPRSHEEMEQLIGRRSQLNEQLNNVTDRRNDIVEQIRTAPNVAEPGLTAQLNVLNDQIVQLETDLAATGRQIASASPDLMAMAMEKPAPQNTDDQAVEGMAAGAVSTFVVMATLLLFLRNRWKRRGGAGRTPQLPDDTSPRLARLEQGMDAIAIEIERISEGQRFVTKLLSESRGAVTPAKKIGESTPVAGSDQTR